MKKRVGIFTGSVSDPFPRWCEVEDDEGNNLGRFHSDHLDDLIYLLTKMKEQSLREQRG